MGGSASPFSPSDLLHDVPDLLNPLVTMKVLRSLLPILCPAIWALSTIGNSAIHRFEIEAIFIVAICLLRISINPPFTAEEISWTVAKDVIFCVYLTSAISFPLLVAHLRALDPSKYANEDSIIVSAGVYCTLMNIVLLGAVLLCFEILALRGKEGNDSPGP